MFSSTTRSSSRPAHHANSSGTLFRNPWPSAEKPTWSEFLTLSNPLSWYNSHNLQENSHAREINVIAPDWGRSSLQKRGSEKHKCVIGTWLGHAGVMVEIPLENVTGRKNSITRDASGEDEKEGEDGQGKKSLWVLFDPIFSFRAGPNQYTGPSRVKPTPCQVSDLPACDAVCISHNHYDHLDLVTIKSILERFPKCKFFVPLGNKIWLSSTGVSSDSIHEMDWWADNEFSPEDFGFDVQEDEKNNTVMKFSCVPAQHNSGRGTLDQGTTLWCGWIVEHFLHPKIPESPNSTTKRIRKGGIYHAGDTGIRRTAKSTEICPIFAEIGNKFGGFDLSFIPIWRGGTLGFISYIGLRLSHQEIPSALHASPNDAMDIHRLVKSKNTVGVHFGTFIGSENESYEATIEFDEAREKQGVGKLEGEEKGGNGRAGLLNIGESVAMEVEVR